MLRTLSIYGVITLGFLGLVALVLFYGQGLGSQPAGLTPTSGSPLAGLADSLHSPFSQLLIQIVAIVMIARLVGELFRRIGQPVVVGEMFAGIALGPSLLGAIAPRVGAFVFPQPSLINLSLLSQVGIVLFMFVIGMELDTKLLKLKANTALLVSQISICLPFLLGMASSLFLFKSYSGARTTFLPFALFMGISMSVTAFPVLARILRERGMAGTQLGNTAIACAAAGDITAWCALAFIVAIAKSQALTGSLLTLGLCLAFLALVFFVMRPFLQALVDQLHDAGSPGRGPVVAALVCVFACALFTEAIGIHALFGAFVAGVAMPKDPEFRQFLRQRLEYFSTLFLLPIFFAFTGLRTQVGLFSGATDWLVCGYLLLVAVVGKLGGSALAARITGMSWRESLAIGALMNTRGLMELIALNLGLDLGVLSPKVFSMLVLMALITTFSTGPIVAKLGFGFGMNPAQSGSTVLEPA